MKRLMSIKLQGQGLIEMVIVILFIAIGVIALVKFQNYLTYSSDLAKQQNDATTLAVQQIETLRSFVVLNNQGSYSSYQNIASGSSNATVGNTTYSIFWTVTAYTNPTYKTLDVTVSWTDRYNVSQSIRLVSNAAGIDPSTSARVM